jgi:hypothetical protein
MRRLLLVVPLLLALCAGQASAQGRFAIELNGGAAFPTEDLGTMALNTGAGAGLTANVRLLPHTHFYAGWEFYRFTPDGTGLTEHIMDTGYAFGAKFEHPFLRDIAGWVRAGGVYNHIEVEDDDDVLADSDHELGWEAGGGLRIPVNDRFAIMPGLRYRTFSVDLSDGATTVPVDMTYLVAEVRLSWTFGVAPSISAIRH